MGSFILRKKISQGSAAPSFFLISGLATRGHYMLIFSALSDVTFVSCLWNKHVLVWFQPQDLFYVSHHLEKREHVPPECFYIQSHRFSVSLQQHRNINFLFKVKLYHRGRVACVRRSWEAAERREQSRVLLTPQPTPENSLLIPWIA